MNEQTAEDIAWQIQHDKERTEQLAEEACDKYVNDRMWHLNNVSREVTANWRNGSELVAKLSTTCPPKRRCFQRIAHMKKMILTQSEPWSEDDILAEAEAWLCAVPEEIRHLFAATIGIARRVAEVEPNK